MAHSRVIVLGSINTDLVIRAARLPAPGETVIGGEYFRAAGGKGANQAVAAARASRGGVTFIGAVGDDRFGRESIERLQSESIDPSYVKVVAGRASGVALIMIDEGGENLISVASGANQDLLPEDVDAVPDEIFREARVFLASLESPWDAVKRGLERARSHGLLTILNPAPALADVVNRESLELVDVITPNRGEASDLSGADTRTTEGVLEAARRLQEAGCGACVITLGAEGCLVLERESVTVQARKVDAIDATAAGDALNGALAVALSEGRPLVEATRWASCAAAIAVTRQGAQPSLAHREEIEALAARG